MQRDSILNNLSMRGISVFLVLTLFSVIFGYLGFFSDINIMSTGFAVADMSSYKASLGGIGSTTVDFEGPKILSKVIANTCYNHKKTGDYYRFVISAYAKKGNKYEFRYSINYPRIPNWIGGKGKKCQNNLVIVSPSAFEQIDRIIIEGVNVKGKPKFSANFEINVKSISALILPPLPSTAVKIDPKYPLPQLPTPKILASQMPKYEKIDASISDFKLTQRGVVVDNNNIDYNFPLMVQFYIKNNGETMIIPYYQIKIDDYPYYEKTLELFKNGAQNIRAFVFYPKFPNLTPGRHTIELNVLGTDYAEKVDVNFVGTQQIPKLSDKPPIYAQPLLYSCPTASLGDRCLIKNNYGQCREGFSRDLTNGKITGKSMNCVMINGNLDGCENMGSDCELDNKRGLCYFKDPKKEDFRLRCYTSYSWT